MTRTEPLPAIGPVPRNVVEHLQRLILQRQLQPGHRLPPQRQLAEQMGISRASLREAVTALETMGLVSIRPGSGVFVTKPGERAPMWRYARHCTLRDIYEARFGLEAYAARLAALHIVDHEHERLHDCVIRMDEAYRRDDVVDMGLADAAFHELIFELSGNPVLAAMYRPVRDMAEESQRMPMIWHERLGETPREHARIAQCVAAGDADGAETAMRDHIRAAAARCGIMIGAAGSQAPDLQA